MQAHLRSAGAGERASKPATRSRDLCDVSGPCSPSRAESTAATRSRDQPQRRASATNHWPRNRIEEKERLDEAAAGGRSQARLSHKPRSTGSGAGSVRW
jgi:hypothetical protein